MRRRIGSPVLISLGVHALALLGLWKLLSFPLSMDLFRRDRSAAITPEKLSFLQLPRAAVPIAGKSGGDDRPFRAAPPPPALQAPSAIPSALPEASRAPVDTTPKGSGERVGNGGPERGVKPAFVDPRIWSVPSAVVAAPKSVAERLDSALAATYGKRQDSLKAAGALPAAPNKFERGDWTVEKGGKKYGIDPQMIRLGSVSIPTALLAMLPLNRVNGNSIVNERERRLNAMHSEIFENASRQMNEAEFRRAVKSLREQKDREKRERERSDKKDGTGPSSPDRD